MDGRTNAIASSIQPVTGVQAASVLYGYGSGGSSTLLNVNLNGQNIQELLFITIFIRASGNWFCIVDVQNQKLTLSSGDIVVDWSANWSTFVNSIAIDANGNLSASFNRFVRATDLVTNLSYTNNNNTIIDIYYKKQN